MASENVELVRSIYALWERDGPSPGSWTGPASLAIGIRDWFTAFEGFSIRPEEFRPLDEERVLVLTHIGGRGKRSGLELAEISSGGAHIFTVRDGRVTKLVRYFDRDHALADLGPEE